MSSSAENTFQHQIKCMMYTFGDARNPNPDSSLLIEEFTRQQIRDIVSHAAVVSDMREGKVMRVDDVMFLLRKDKEKLKRLIKYMDIKKKVNKPQSNEDEPVDASEFTTGFQKAIKKPPPAKKRKTYLPDFLTPADISGIDFEGPDEVEIQRLEQQDAITRNMNAKEYMEYAECRYANFHRNSGKFKDWVDVESVTQLKINADIIEVLCYLASETVKRIVELSLLVKSDMESTYTVRPLASSASHSHFGHDPTLTTPPFPGSVSVSADNGINSGGAGSLTQALGTPPPSPPTNLLNSPLNTTDNESLVAIGTSSLRRSSRERKRRRSGGTTQPQEQDKAMQPTHEPVPTTVTVSERKAAPTALQPVHIREALRRYSQASLTAPVSPLWTHHFKPSLKQSTLCL